MFATIHSFDNHGVFSGICDEPEIEKVIDEVMSKFGQHKLTHDLLILECASTLNDTVSRRTLDRFMKKNLLNFA